MCCPKLICVIILLTITKIYCVDEQFENSYDFSTKSEIDYTDGLPLKDNEFFDFDEKLVNNTTAITNDDRVTMVIPKKIKEIDARKMKNIRNIRADSNFSNPFENYVSLSNLLNIYNTEMLIKNFEIIKLGINTQCRDDLEEFIEGLRDGVTWALKMDDSNGRYTSGFFWGNNYWTGSQTQCLHIVPESAQTQDGTNPFKTTVVSFITKIIQPQNYTGIVDETLNSNRMNQSSRLRRDAMLPETKKSSLSPSLTVGYQHGKLVHESLPNFVPSYFALRILLNSTQDVTPKIRTIQLGLCMPLSCSDNEVQMIVETVASDVKHTEIMVSEVRSQHQYYNMWRDKIFWLLVCVSFIVGVLLFAGTVYDYHLIKQDNKKKILNLNCTTYDLTQAEHQLEKHITLDIGKTGRYVVNETYPESDESSRENFNINSCTPHILTEILLAFSVRMNLKTICDKSVGSDTIPTIHGLRAISMAWVILGHTCIIIFKYSDNMEFRKVAEQEFLFQSISNGVYSVDTFFFISGLLVSYLYLRTNAKGTLKEFTKGATKFQTGVLHFIGLITYRFARLTAPYLYVLGVVQVCMKWHNYNAVFEPPTMDHVNCPKYWWRNILYINTLYPVEEMCMLWSWYLADDTQFYIIGIICLIIGISHAKAATSLMILFIVSSWVTTSYVAFINKHVPNLDDPLALFDLIYDKPWTRLGPYLIGMGTGYLLFKTDCRIRMSKLTVAVGWFLSSSCLLCLIYGFYQVEFSSYMAAAFSALSHSVWAFGLSWIVIACTCGYGGWVNKILSATILYPFSRVTYCAYLIHPLCIRYLIMQMDSPLHLGKDLIATLFLGQVVISYILSFIISLSFEAPIVSILRIWSPNKTKKLR